MPIINRIAEFHDDVAAWRRDIHAHPELQFEVHRTAALVADKLKAFGVDEVVTGIGRTGVVGVIHGRKTDSGRTIGLRADMDALPIEEAVDRPHKSTVAGVMHACGHDGHTAMLLGAARYLAETRNFDGTAVVIFQPAEEGGGGGREMVDEGMMERFGIDEVYGMHNAPGLPFGQFALRRGSMMAAADMFVIDIEGYGGHAARPQRCIDTTLVGAHIMTALQSVVARNVDPVESAVISVTTFKAGDAFNVIPQTARLTGTARTLSPAVRDLLEARMAAVVENTAAAFGARATLDYQRHYPVLSNHAAQAEFAAGVARQIVGDAVDLETPPVMGGEDFAFMLEARPGAFIYLGQGDTAYLHHPEYDFDDAIIPLGCSYWAKLVETALPAG
ncbi:M20 family metallopeptidase [Aquibium sp. A9E412]|uniref:M20 aminoacylase family protein n=1 Tax=Aquibium sp. A9E412 TaxID=2976767 RepID=UPI0025B062D5|nr:M20 aminoacylase family protein [Aquibium sp. A9E412]MDN2567827.1 M20 family metallopeptidase [Aquibium sp. A9E412]